MIDTKDLQLKIEKIAEVLGVEVLTKPDDVKRSLLIKYHVTDPPNTDFVLVNKRPTANKFIYDCEWIRPYGLLFEYFESENSLKESSEIEEIYIKGRLNL